MDTPLKDNHALNIVEKLDFRPLVKQTRQNIALYNQNCVLGELS